MPRNPTRRSIVALSFAALCAIAFLSACPPPTGTVPSVPTNLKVLSYTDTTVTLSWDASSGAMGYRVYRSTTGAYSKVADIATTTWTDTGLTSQATYSYKVSAYNDAGESAQSGAVTATTGAGPAAASAALNAGLGFLNENPPDFDQALTQFALAAQADPTNGPAVLWMVALTLMQTIVSPDMQTLATTYIGVTGYPTSMDAFFAMGPHGVPSWMGYPVSGDGGITYGYFPQIGIPSSIRGWEGNPSITTPNEYMLGILYNVITRNQTGLDALVDHVVNNVLAKPLDQAIASLKGVPDSAQIAFTPDVVPNGAAMGWPLDASNHPIPLTIGKAELLGLSAFLQMIESMAYMAKTIDLTLPLQTYWTNLNPVDNPTLYSGTSPAAAFFTTLYTLANPISAGFLRARAGAATSLGQAKTAYLAALDSMDTALTDLLARTGSTFILSPQSPLPDVQTNWSFALQVMEFEQIAVGKEKASIQSGTTMYIPTEPTELSNPTTFFANYSTPGAWPTQADDGPYSNSGPTAVAVNLAPVFATPLAALDTILELNPTNGEPVWYEFTDTFKLVNGKDLQLDAASLANLGAPITSLSGATAATQSAATGWGALTNQNPVTAYAIRLKDLTFNGTLVIDDTSFNNIKLAIMNSFGATTPPFSSSALDSMLVRNPTTGAITAYLPVFPAFVAANSFLANTDTVSVDPDGVPGGADDFTYTTRGSFWWGLVDMTQANKPYVLSTY